MKIAQPQASCPETDLKYYSVSYNFSNTENAIPGDRLAKIKALLDLLEIKYKKGLFLVKIM